MPFPEKKDPFTGKGPLHERNINKNKAQLSRVSIKPSPFPIKLIDNHLWAIEFFSKYMSNSNKKQSDFIEGIVDQINLENKEISQEKDIKLEVLDRQETKHILELVKSKKQIDDIQSTVVVRHYAENFVDIIDPAIGWFDSRKNTDECKFHPTICLAVNIFKEGNYDKKKVFYGASDLQHIPIFLSVPPQSITGFWAVKLKTGEESAFYDGVASQNPIIKYPEFIINNKYHFDLQDNFTSKNYKINRSGYTEIPIEDVAKIYFVPFGDEYKAPIKLSGPESWKDIIEKK